MLKQQQIWIFFLTFKFAESELTDWLSWIQMQADNFSKNVLFTHLSDKLQKLTEVIVKTS